MEDLESIKKLVNQLNSYRDAYYNNQQSLISDYEYDNLFDTLETLEKQTGIILSNSPTQTVGYTVESKLKKVKHSHPMLSLAKTKSSLDLMNFAADNECILSCKMDGLTILLTYEDGKLCQAETRGNGEEGEIITHNAKVFENIPLTIPFKDHFEIEGEAVITLDDFDTINNSIPKELRYKTPRNLVSGSVRQLDSKIAKSRHIKFIAWKVNTECGYLNFFSYRLKAAADLGFDVVPFYLLPTKYTQTELDKFIAQLKAEAAQKNYPIDGLVMTYNDITYGKKCGMTGHHPKHSLAYKFYDDEFETKLVNIEYSMGKTGVLTPVAVFEPVEIDGTIVERASLSNLSIKADTLGVPYKGEPIWITKRNQIIPKIERATKKDIADITREEAITIPLYCPICGKLTDIVKDNNSEVLVCTNSECRGKLLGKLAHFCSKNAMNIDGLSVATLDRFISLGWLTTYADLYRLELDYKLEIENLAGFGYTSAMNLFFAIEESKTTTLYRFLYALNIPLIGMTASKIIAKRFNGNFNRFWNAYLNKFDFTLLDNFGKSMDCALYDFLSTNAAMVENLANILYFEEPDILQDCLAGQIFVITGATYRFKNRDELKAKIEALGGKVANSVSKNTTYLINNDNTSISAKNKKAKELAIPVITEVEFMQLIGEN